MRVLLGRAVRSAYAAMDEREGRGCYAPTPSSVSVLYLL